MPADTTGGVYAITKAPGTIDTVPAPTPTDIPELWGPYVVNGAILFVSHSATTPSAFVTASTRPGLTPGAPEPATGDENSIDRDTELGVVVPVGTRSVIAEVALHIPGHFAGRTRREVPLVRPVSEPGEAPPVSTVRAREVSQVTNMQITRSTVGEPNGGGGVGDTRIQHFGTLHRRFAIVSRIGVEEKGAALTELYAFMRGYEREG